MIILKKIQDVTVHDHVWNISHWSKVVEITRNDWTVYLHTDDNCIISGRYARIHTYREVKAQ